MSPNCESACESTVRLSADLHARPAGQVVQTVARFDASVKVGFGDLEVDAGGVLAVMRLGATAGNEITLRASGPEAEQAVAALTLLLGTPEPTRPRLSPGPSPVGPAQRRPPG